MDLLERINQDLKEAMKAGDEPRKLALRSAKAAITRAQKAEDNQPLSEDEIIAVLRKEVKQRQDSIEAYAKAGRPDLVAAEQSEMAILSSYLPTQMDEAAIRAHAAQVIAELGATGPKDMGKVMGRMMADLKGKADGSLISLVVRQLLSGS